MIKVVAAISATLVLSLIANAMQFYVLRSDRDKHKAELVAVTLKAYIQAKTLEVERQAQIDKLLSDSLDREQETLSKILASKNAAISKLRALRNEKVISSDCRVDAERVRIVNEKLSDRRRS